MAGHRVVYQNRMSLIDPIALSRALIMRPSVTPADEGALDIVEKTLTDIGFVASRLVFEEEGTAPVSNLYARWGDGAPNFCFAGHTDVVPTGAESAWIRPPFSAEIANGYLWGRGAADMKSAIAAFMAAAERAIMAGPVNGSISMLITGDEEGVGVNGTRKVLAWLKERNEQIDHCLVGEPTNFETLGDMLKVGRRGSANFVLTVKGKQGHVAYPDRARNPIPALLRKLLALSETALDQGFERFQPSSLQVTDIHVGNPAHNVIPASASARFNVRFNPNWTGGGVERWVREKISSIAAEAGVNCELDATISGEAFLTSDERFLTLLTNAIERRTGRRPALSTSGGTSDARFIKDFAPVAEFGLVGATMHQIDECVAVADILTLTDIYADIIDGYFMSEARA